ncbi:hypothetical protein RRG08_013838 [Elysia crispata]|uniref:Uncharacterized protein n=1 Tax=Elysia crispata TaxID=231223 RepID=A0AAE0YXA4_9GAST|nr:hypothetical protein RRG08_013838 [Elysia crispata]
MEFYWRLMIYVIFVTMVLMCTAGVMFDFHPMMQSRNFSTHERYCHDLGYDGLAIISTPEAYHYALKLTEYVRTVLSKGFYLGGRYRPEAGLVMWDDDTVPRSDSPFSPYPPKIKSHLPYTRMRDTGKIVMATDYAKRSGMCGNHNNYPTESRGTTMRGKLQTIERTILSGSQVFSYLECALLCGMVLDCRVAELNTDLLTCTIIGEYNSTGYIANPQIVSYIRETF